MSFSSLWSSLNFTKVVVIVIIVIRGVATGFQKTLLESYHEEFR